jgi:hypothetical protein
VVSRILQNRQQCFELAGHLHLPVSSAMQTLVSFRNVQSRKMVHAALLLPMLEAVATDLVFTISLKRSTQISSYPQAGRPITPSSSLSDRS